MLTQLSDLYNILFIGIAFIAIYFFSKACNHNRMVLLVILAFMLIQSLLGVLGFYSTDYSMPPRFLLAILPSLTLVLYMTFSEKGKEFISRFNPKWLTYLHIVRFPVEIFLYLLFIHKLLPIEMTFEGRNIDIIFGITAPIVSYFVFTKKILAERTLFYWNILGLVSLVNIVGVAILSTKYPFQVFGFEQPNIAVFYFPYIWLPSIIVPLVLMSHLIVIKRLWQGRST